MWRLTPVRSGPTDLRLLRACLGVCTDASELQRTQNRNYEKVDYKGFCNSWYKEIGLTLKGMEGSNLKNQIVNYLCSYSDLLLFFQKVPLVSFGPKSFLGLGESVASYHITCEEKNLIKGKIVSCFLGLFLYLTWGCENQLYSKHNSLLLENDSLHYDS